MKVAIVHYWLVNMRGGEKMLEALLELFPDADIFTHVYDPAAVSALIRSHNVYTTRVQKLPLAKKLYQKYLPFMPDALKELDVTGYDLVISSESGPAKGVVPAPDAYHLCYCHSPMRYLWDMYHEYFRGAGFLTRFFMKRMVPALRLWDVTSANLVDRFITNSRYTAKRIARCYNRAADVVFGPVALERFLAVERCPAPPPDSFYLFFGQLVGYKRADIAVEACVKSGRKLVVAGSGADKKLLTAAKSGLVAFRGRVSDAEIDSLFSRARALIFPGIEDLGLVPIEANAAGLPVIAYRKGGALDTVKEGVTGLFFDEQTPESLIAALDTFEKNEHTFTDRSAFTSHVRQFSKEAFKERVQKIIAERKRI